MKKLTVLGIALVSLLVTLNLGSYSHAEPVLREGVELLILKGGEILVSWTEHDPNTNNFTVLTQHCFEGGAICGDTTTLLSVNQTASFFIDEVSEIVEIRGRLIAPFAVKNENGVFVAIKQSEDKGETWEPDSTIPSTIPAEGWIIPLQVPNASFIGGPVLDASVAKKTVCLYTTLRLGDTGHIYSACSGDGLNWIDNQLAEIPPIEDDDD